MKSKILPLAAVVTAALSGQMVIQYPHQPILWLSLGMLAGAAAGITTRLLDRQARHIRFLQDQVKGAGEALREANNHDAS